MDPQVIILDEPTAGLDPNSKHQVMSLIKKIQIEENKTIILVSHDMDDVARYSDEVVVMNKGTIVRNQILEIYLIKNAIIKVAYRVA